MWDSFEERRRLGLYPEAFFSGAWSSHFGGEGTRFFSGENLPCPPGYDEYHTWRRGFPEMHGAPHHRLPLWEAFAPCVKAWKGSRYRPSGEGLCRRDFCSYIASTPVAFRDEFVESLQKATGKRVDCAGACLNNVPRLSFFDSSGRQYDWNAKIDFASRYKFAVAFENSKADGYATEKALHAIVSATVPVYWGGGAEDFGGSRHMILVDEQDPESAIDEVKQLDGDDELYMDKLCLA